MNNEEYARIIESAERLERSLFDLSSEENINRLETILDEQSKKNGETMIGVPLVQPYGGPTCEYIALPERVYYELRNAMRHGEVSHVYPEIGVPYDKRRFYINREQLRKGFEIPREYAQFMEKIRKKAKNIKVYQEPALSH
jgi:hypothetical protein